ncbi:hypothetical protein GQ53DRAFT_190740 [Thozetella sp. PMI_491]|nr:hypothetical protein GQ53DRAFT_190740 [Thozetella sp. PMI_491]
MASRSSSEEKPGKRRQQKQVYESDGEESEEYAPPQRRRNQRQQKGGQGPLDNLALDSVQNTAGGLVNGATGALGGITGGAMQNQGGGDKKSDTLRLRLDLNLDIEITLKAKIHGDLELALLRPKKKSRHCEGGALSPSCWNIRGGGVRGGKARLRTKSSAAASFPSFASLADSDQTSIFFSRVKEHEANCLGTKQLERFVYYYGAKTLEKGCRSCFFC